MKNLGFLRAQELLNEVFDLTPHLHEILNIFNRNATEAMDELQRFREIAIGCNIRVIIIF